MGWLRVIAVSGWLSLVDLDSETLISALEGRQHRHMESAAVKMAKDSQRRSCVISL